jgi:hypothetical protein
MPFELETLSGAGLEQEPFWKELYHNGQDAFFPRRLPPLELTSKPVAVADPMQVRRSPVSTAIAVGIHVVILALIAWLVAVKVRPALQKPRETAQNIDIKPFIPITPKGGATRGGGGGGGSHDLVQVSKGRQPRIAQTKINPPKLFKN